MAARVRQDRVAAFIRAQICDGILKPGDSVPTGTEIADLTGCSVPTARKAIRALTADGTLARTPNRRYCVPNPTPDPGPDFSPVSGPVSSAWLAARTLAAALTYRRLTAGLTTGELAEQSGYVLTVVGDAESARPWQPRAFWERVDAVLRTGGELAALHDLYRAAIAPSQSPGLCRTCPYRENGQNLPQADTGEGG
jgi:DNA-binding transcriptional MocR family regulator